MQLQKRTIQIGLMLASIMVSLSCLFAQPAQAIIRDQAIVGRLQDQHDVLLLREKRLLQDYDDLQKQIRDFQRMGDQRIVDDLSRAADNKYSDLKSVRYNLRQIETLLM
ncbi:MAG TPA: hypothetical protein V6D22_23525 [Candidatus Obscuribacterales bacterium]